MGEASCCENELTPASSSGRSEKYFGREIKINKKYSLGESTAT
jgi:hypothetical protein